MENQNEIDEPPEQHHKVELEKHLPEWFFLLRKLVAEHLNKQQLPEDAGTKFAPEEGRNENKPVEI